MNAATILDANLAIWSVYVQAWRQENASGIAGTTQAENARYRAYGLTSTDPRRDAVPTGTSCRFCERTDCNQRAAASYRFAFSFDEYTKKDCFFSPLLVHEAGRNGGEHREPSRAESLDKSSRRRNKGEEN